MGLFSRRKKTVWFEAELSYDDADEVLARLRDGGVEQENLDAVLQESGAKDLDVIVRALGDLRAIPGRALLDRSAELPKGGFFPSDAPALPGVDPLTGRLFLYPRALIAECSGRDYRPPDEQIRWRVRALERVSEDVLEDMGSDGWIVEADSPSGHG